MPKLTIREIKIDPTVQIRRGNREDTVRRYMEAFEQLPPVTVFKTPEGLLLADGFHRVAAAERLGLRAIEAEIRKGTREDALEFAVVGNIKNADPLNEEERDAGIRRLKQLHDDWSQQKIAKVMSVSQATVSHVLKVAEVGREVMTRHSLNHTILREIGKAPKEKWQPLAEAAAERGWSSDMTALARQNLEDRRIPEEHKKKLLAGKADPVIRTPEGELAVPTEVVSRRLREQAANDAILTFQQALQVLAKARLFKPEGILEPADRDTLDYWVKELPGDIRFLQDVLDGAQGRRKLRLMSQKEKVSDGKA